MHRSSWGGTGEKNNGVLIRAASAVISIRLAALLALLAVCAAVRAQAPAAPASDPRFEIRQFVVEGASLLTSDEVDAAVTPYAGPNRDFSDVQRALEALEKAYTDKGYSAVQVLLPEQELEKGEVHFKIVEAKVAKIVVEGNKFFDEANVRRSLPSVTPGQSPNIRHIAENLKVANENPAKQTTVLLRGGAEEGQVDAVVRVTDEKPTKYSITFDNTGTPQTGIFRVGFGFQYANLWNRDHVISMQYVTSPSDSDHPNTTTLYPNHRVFIFGSSYRIPLYSAGDSIDITAGYSNVNSGVVQNLFNVSGAGTIAGLRYNKNLPKWADLEQRLALGIDWRGYSSKVTAVGSGLSLVPDITVHPISLTYIGLYRGTASESSFNVGAVQNLAGGNDGGSSSFQAARTGAPPDYFMWRYGASHLQAFPNDWQMRLAMNGQATKNRLVAGEQFGIGGADSVRGYLEREVTGDRGIRGSVEFYTPDYSSRIANLLPGGSRLRSVVFYDWGQVRRYQALIGEIQQQGLGSFGVGMRYSRSTNTSLRADYAVTTDAGGLQGRSEGRLHASFAYIF
jgi:hemolysin activation/secretion protein